MKYPWVVVSYPKSGRTWIRYALWLVGANLHFTHAGEETRPVGHSFLGVHPKVLSFEKRVLLRRNPIDASVSYFFWIHSGDMDTDAPKDINEFVLHPFWGVPKAKQFNDAWTNYIDGLILDYESLRGNPHKEFSRLLKYLGIAANVSEVVKRSSFEAMLAVEADEFSLGPRKLRRGEVGDYKNHLRADTIEELEACLKN